MSLVQTSQVVAQFLEAVVHSILYHRNVYPPTSFENTQLYGMVVHQNRHPMVGDYIREATRKAVASNHVLVEFRIIICSDDQGDTLPGDEHKNSTDDVQKNRPTEDQKQEVYRLVFSPCTFDDMETYLDDSANHNSSDTKQDATSERQAEKLKWYRMQDDLRATLLRLEVLCRAQPVPCADDPDALAQRTFRIQLVTKPTADGREERERERDNSYWMVVQRPAVTPGPRRATPVHTVRLVEGIHVSMRIE